MWGWKGICYQCGWYEFTKTEDLDEVHIYKKIRSELGILPVRLVYSPEGMEIEKYELNTDLQKAMLLYKYKEQTVKYTMYMNNADSSLGRKRPIS